MPHLVYREDTNGVRYLVCGNVSQKEAQDTLQRLTSGKPHKHDYKIVAYEPHAMHHALHKGHLNDDAQDMRNMGGLRSAMPITFITFLVSTIAIAGIPGFSGFFSKDEILWQAFANPYHGSVNIILWGVGCIAACFTAFYMFRLVFMTFFGEPRGAARKDRIDAPHRRHAAPASGAFAAAAAGV